MSAPGSAVAADVPAKYDVVINGFGYCYADTVDPSIPFRTHRAIYDITPTFVERSNTSNQYGDQTQDFFLTASQRDFSLGSEQRFFRSTDADSARKFYAGKAVDALSTQGQVTAAQAMTTVANLAAWKSACGAGVGVGSSVVAGATASNLHTVDSTGTLTDQGAHGAGTHAGAWGLCSDGKYVYIAGATKIRKWDGSTFTDFSVTANVGALATLNNALFSCDGSTLNTYDGSGTQSTLFTWKDNTNTARAKSQVKLLPFGGQLLIYFPYLYEGPELWVYDGTGTSRLVSLPDSSVGYDACVEFGIVYLSALDVVAGGLSRPMLYYYANGTLGVAYQSLGTYPVLPSATSIAQPPLASYAGKLAFVDWTDRTLRQLDPATGAVQGISGSFGVPNGGQIVIGAAAAGVVVSLGSGVTSLGASVFGQYYPAATQSAAGLVQTSQFDFDSSLVKTFRGVKVDWAGSGTVDISYQIDGVGGSYTSLQTSAVSGTEYLFPTNTVGHTVSVQVTLNSSGGVAPIVKRIYVRAAPQLSQFRSGTYILDCTGNPDEPRQLRDGGVHPLTGYEQAQNLLAAAKSATPFTVTDPVNGTFTGIVDLQDAEGWDVYQVHPVTDNPKKPGSFLIRLKIREV